MKLEYCCLCDEPTGNAGKLDGSNYAEDGTGAYCDSCFAAYNAGLERAIKYKQALEEIREVYAGMDGFIAESAPEAYQQRLLKQMYDLSVEAIRREIK